MSMLVCGWFVKHTAISGANTKYFELSLVNTSISTTVAGLGSGLLEGPPGGSMPQHQTRQEG